MNALYPYTCVTPSTENDIYYVFVIVYLRYYSYLFPNRASGITCYRSLKSIVIEHISSSLGTCHCEWQIFKIFNASKYFNIPFLRFYIRFHFFIWVLFFNVLIFLADLVCVQVWFFIFEIIGKITFLVKFSTFNKN